MESTLHAVGWLVEGARKPREGTYSPGCLISKGYLQCNGSVTGISPMRIWAGLGWKVGTGPKKDLNHS